jgi:hypothetical protein
VLDLTSVFLATGPAAIAGATGFYGARLSNRATIRQAEVQIEQVNLENYEANRRERQTVYHELLDHLRGFDATLVSLASNGTVDRDAFSEWSARFDHLANGAVLFGTDHVRECVQALAEFLTGLAIKPGQRTAMETADNLTAFQAAYQSLIDAMREDVARSVSG